MPPITALDLARQYQGSEATPSSKVCIHGYSGAGKTVLAGTLSKVPYIKRIFWVDLEDGVSSIITATNPDGSPYFTDEELSKIIYIPIQDRVLLDNKTGAFIGLANGESGKGSVKGKVGAHAAIASSNAQAAKIVLPHIFSATPVHYDTVLRQHVLQPNDNTVSWCLQMLGASDALVIDSGTQLGNSIFSLGLEANSGHEHGPKHWAEFTQNAVALLSALQASKCAIIFICHTLTVEADQETGRKAKQLPWFGSMPFSQRVGHYFGTVLYMYTDTKYRSVSTPLSRASIMAKSRYAVNTALIQNPTMLDILTKTPAAIAARTYIGGTETQSPKATPAQQAQPQQKPANKSAASASATPNANTGALLRR